MRFDLSKDRILKNCKNWFEVQYFAPALVPQWSHVWEKPKREKNGKLKVQHKIIELPAAPIMSNAVIQLYALWFSVRIDMGGE